MSPSQSPSSMYSHAPTVIHHSAHRSALARKATRQLSRWTESPSSSHDHHSNTSSPRASAPPPSRQTDYSYNGNYNAEYRKSTQSPAHLSNRYQPTYSPYNDNDVYAVDGDDSDQISSVQSQSGPTVRKYSDLNFDDEDDEIGFVQMGRREKVGGEWGTPESALAGIGRQATRMMRAATSTTKKTTPGSAGGKEGIGLGLGIGGAMGAGGANGIFGAGFGGGATKRKDQSSISPSTSITSKASGGARQKMGELLSTASRQRGRDRDRDFLASGSKVSIASDQSRETATTRTSSSESSVGEAIITPNHSSAFTPYHDHTFSSAIKYTYPTRTAAVPISSRTPTLAPSAQIHASSDGHKPKSSLSPATFSLSPTPSGFTASDRPLLSSGSPGFGLISLEVAQERERVRLGGPTPKSSSSKRDVQQQQQQTTPRLPAVPSLPTTQSQKIRNKKSLISLFRSATSYASGSGGNGNGGTGSAPPVPGFSMVSTGGKRVNIGEPMPLMYPSGQAEMSAASGMAAGRQERQMETAAAAAVAEYRESRENQSRKSPLHTQTQTLTARSLLPGPKLELRPVSMMLANGLPEDYLASTSSSDVAADDLSYPGADGRSSVFTSNASLSSASSANIGDDSEIPDNLSSASAEVLALRKELANLKKTHAYQQSELSSQLREAKDQLQASRDEMEELQTEKERRAPREDGCTECGCTCGMAVSEMLMGSAPSPRPSTASGGSVMGRARSGTTSRSVRSVKSVRSTTSGRADYSGIQVPNVPVPDRGAGSKGVMDRGRAKTGGARGVFGTGSLYEWE